MKRGERNEYTIIVRGVRIMVSEKIYRAYHQEREYARHVIDKARENELSLEYFEENGIHPRYTYTPPSVEDILINQELRCRLRKVLQTLPKNERDIIHKLFVEIKTERQAGNELGISQRTLHDKKARILAKLYKLLK